MCVYVYGQVVGPHDQAAVSSCHAIVKNKLLQRFHRGVFNTRVGTVLIARVPDYYMVNSTSVVCFVAYSKLVHLGSQQ